METGRTIYLVTEYASNGEIFGKIKLNFYFEFLQIKIHFQIIYSQKEECPKRKRNVYLVK